MEFRRVLFRSDFDYFLEIIRENNPHLGYFQRNNMGREEEYEKMREIVKSAQTPQDIYNIINTLCKFEFKNYAHLTPLHFDTFSYYYKYFSDERLSDLSNMPETVKKYMEYCKKIFTDERAYSLYDGQIKEKYGKEESVKTYSRTENYKSYLKAEIIEENRIARIIIPTFTFPDEEKDIMYEYLTQFKDYEHLIFDIRGNGGGNSNYWAEGIVPYIIKEPTTWEYYLIFKDTEAVRAWSRISEAEPISNLPIYDKLDENTRQDIEYVDIFIHEKVSITNDENLHVSAKIWILQDKNVYSAADGFVSCAKDTNIATLIGQTSGGDGVGRDILPILLDRKSVV